MCPQRSYVPWRGAVPGFLDFAEWSGFSWSEAATSTARYRLPGSALFSCLCLIQPNHMHLPHTC
jgi:hypothetical protein